MKETIILALVFVLSGAGLGLIFYNGSKPTSPVIRTSSQTFERVTLYSANGEVLRKWRIPVGTVDWGHNAKFKLYDAGGNAVTLTGTVVWETETTNDYSAIK